MGNLAIHLGSSISFIFSYIHRQDVSNCCINFFFEFDCAFSLYRLPPTFNPICSSMSVPSPAVTVGFFVLRRQTLFLDESLLHMFPASWVEFIDGSSSQDRKSRRGGSAIGSSFYLLRKAFVSPTCLVPVRGCGEYPLIAKDYQ